MTKKFVFEEAVARLEEIVDLLSRGDAPLDESLALFEEGTGLIKKCGEALDKAEQKVELLIKSQDGPVTAPFDGEDEQ
ncbi:MAG: exodeoxyribonuclease VII small subunit [Ruminococcaceae bacterium]|jgi:exodeoxyribonuclease VII small subunit|nr:exodeoxyribonuclease VII small subunit [Oscillospiraceae bacterium]